MVMICSGNISGPWARLLQSYRFRVSYPYVRQGCHVARARLERWNRGPHARDGSEPYRMSHLDPIEDMGVGLALRKQQFDPFAGDAIRWTSQTLEEVTCRKCAERQLGEHLLRHHKRLHSRSVPVATAIPTQRHAIRREVERNSACLGDQT